MPRKPITDKDAPLRPWRINESKGGKLYIYAAGENQPIRLVHSYKKLTRRDRATLELICVAVNKFHKLNLGFILEQL
jgi:hypothetical protein